MEDAWGEALSRGGMLMTTTHRAGLLIVCVALLAVVILLPSGSGPIAQGLAAPPPAPDKKDKPPPDPDKLPGGSEALILPTDRQAKRRLEAAADYIKAQSWGDAVRLLQQVLDAPEDGLVPVRRPGKPGAEWGSARAEALRVLGSLPPQALEHYQVQFGAAAKARLEEARKESDPNLLDEVARRYPYTAAGLEALRLAASNRLDRGRFEEAAACFRLLLERQPDDRAAPATLFKAALAFHLADDRAESEQTWQRLAARVGPEGFRLGGQVVRLEQLRAEIDRFPVRPRRAGDVALFRGDARRSGEGAGGIAYLDPLWQRPTADHEATRDLVGRAVRAQEEATQPCLPGACPLLVGGKLIYRSYGGLCAVDPRTGTELWRAGLPASLDACLADPSAGKTVSVLAWAKQYAPGGTVTVAGLGALGGGGVLGGVNLGIGGGQTGPTVYAPPLVFENTALGTLSSDGRRVYAIDDVALPPPPVLLQEQPGVHRPLGPLGERLRYNRLLALDVLTGKPAWERGGEAPPPVRKPKPGAAPEDDLLGCYFLGPPLPVSGRLYVLVEKQGEVMLTCLDPVGGGFLWSQPLASVREKLLTDVGRRVQAVHLAFADGVLVCPTNAGAVLGIDVLSRSLLWAYVYHAPPAPAPDGGAPPAVPMAISPESGPLWKASVPILRDGKLLFTAADDTSLHCLNLRDGSLLWKTARTDDDLYLAAVCGDRVLVVGKTACRALNLADGSKTLWSLPTGVPSGQGILCGNVYYLPLQGRPLASASGLSGPLASASGLPDPLAGASGLCPGGLWAVDAVKGQVLARAEVRRGGAPGNLLFHDGDVLAQSVTAVAAYPQLRTKLAAISARLAQDPRDPAALAERGDLKLHQGDLEGAIADLRQVLAGRPPAGLLPATRDRLYEAMTRLLQRDFRAGERYLDEYRQLCRVPVPAGATPDERSRLEAEQLRRQTNLWCLQARGAERHATHPDDVLRAYVDLYGDDAVGQLVTVLDDPSVKARLDVWARSRVDAVLAAASGPGKQVGHDLVAQQWRQARSGGDAALARFAALFGSAGAEGRAARLLLAERLLADRQPGHTLAAELTLLRLRREADGPVLAARATEALARLLADKVQLEDALHYYRILARDFGGVVVRDGKTGADFLNELHSDKRFLPYFQAPSGWAGGRIQAQRPPDPSPQSDAPPRQDPAAPGGTPGPQVMTFQFEGERTPFLEKHVLVLDLLSSRLRLLDRATGAELWGDRLVLDSLRGSLIQNNGVGSVVPCPVQGHLAVLSLGAVVYGIDLLDRRVLWKKTLTDGPFLPDRMNVVVRDGDGDNYRSYQLVSVDRFGRGDTHVLGRLGPVGAGYVAVFTSAGLAALDPLTGETLWVRGDVAADAESFGDDRDLFLVERNASATRALRTLDGAVVAGVPAFGEQYGQKLKALGSRLLLADSGGEKLVLRLYDARSGKDLWKAETKDAVPIQSDDPMLAGWVGRDGQVALFDVRTGKQILRTKIDPAHVAAVKDVHLLRDARRFYLAFYTEPDAAAKLGDPSSCVNSMRCVPVNGMVYAFDRATGELCWFNRVASQMLVAEQFEQLPILLFADAVTRQEGGNPVQSLQVLSIDKETGKRLLGYTARNTANLFHTLQVDVRGKTIDLIGVSFRVRHFEAPPKK
jgi:outer membrane protein assembly factor BamB/tetratricopeptide (TPR) repeat protein